MTPSTDNQPAAPEPPKRGRGQPRKLPIGTVRTTVRIPPDVLAMVERAARERGCSVNDEIVRRCAKG